MTVRPPLPVFSLPPLPSQLTSLPPSLPPVRVGHSQVVLRLARAPLSRNARRYTLVATNTAARLSALPLETLGHYDPVPKPAPKPSLSPNNQPRPISLWSTSEQTEPTKVLAINKARVGYWLGVGAKPSKTVERLLRQAGVSV